jgi:hypothetical protein
MKGKGAAPEHRGYWRSDLLKKCGVMGIRHITAHQRLYPVLSFASASRAKDLQRF